MHRIDATVRQLSSHISTSPSQDEAPATAALDAFLAEAKLLHRRPVLLVDNLQLVFERISAQQQHVLRELLLRPAGPLLIGASPSLPPESQDYGAAFYDHFKIHYLSLLSVDEMRQVMLTLAEKFGTPQIRERVTRHPHRLKVLRQLTGGNPRTTVTLFFLYAEDFSPTVFGDLENLLDRVTPLYKARFEELSAQQQVVASAIANHWDPVTARTLADRTGLPTTGISPQLDRLEKIGFIERVELFGESSTGFQIAERFFNVWFLMRSSSRRQKSEVAFLTRFIESFYENEDRSKLAQQIQTECNDQGETTSTLPRFEPLLSPPELQIPDSLELQHTLFAAYAENWGQAREALERALALIKDGFPVNTVDDWHRASAVLLHLNYGEQLLAFLKERGDDLRLRPWYEALSALHRGNRQYLQNLAPEVRTTAEVYFDQIEKRLHLLPEKTRRRPLPKPPQVKSTRSRKRQ